MWTLFYHSHQKTDDVISIMPTPVIGLDTQNNLLNAYVVIVTSDGMFCSVDESELLSTLIYE